MPENFEVFSYIKGSKQKSVEVRIFKRRLLAVPLACQEDLRQAFNKVHGDVKSVDMSVCFIEIHNSMPLPYYDE